MQRQDTLRSDTAVNVIPETLAQPASSACNEDCVIMLEAIRLRVSGLIAPLTTSHATARATDYQAYASRMALDECDAAIRHLLAMVDPQQGGVAQIAQDVLELRVLLSGAQERR